MNVATIVQGVDPSHRMVKNVHEEAKTKKGMDITEEAHQAAKAAEVVMCLKTGSMTEEDQVDRQSLGAADLETIVKARNQKDQSTDKAC